MAKTASNKDENKVVETAKEANGVLKEENEMLKARLDELTAQMALLAKMIPDRNQVAEEKPKSKRRITFYNMTPNTLILKGTRSHRIEGQFGKDSYPESEAAAIVSNMPNAIRDGLVYIADSKFIEEQELDAIYETILSDSQLKELLSRDSQYVIDVYKNAGKGQQEIIIEMVEQKRLNGETVDANILMQLGALCKKDLMHIDPLES